ncbi:MAG: hypothetical protein FWE37_08005 [Spirochaetaceae bacterium]|nr:hypothetical protein [Spirochaetaceae bacterium]
MLWPGLKKLGKELNLTLTSSEVVGVIKNCFIKMYDGNSIKVLEIYPPQIDEDDKNFIADTLVKNKVKNYTYHFNSLIINFNEVLKPYSITKIKNLLLTFTDYFAAKHGGEVLCQECKESKEPALYIVNKVAVYWCQNCLNKEKHNYEIAQREQAEIPNNYLAGFGGALLFALPGILISVIFFVFLNSIVALAAVVYTFLATKGYKQFKGKKTLLGEAIIIGVSLVMIGVGTLVAYSVFILRIIETFDITLLLSVLALAEVQQELLSNLAMTYLVSSFFIILQIIFMLKDYRVKFKIEKL